MIMISAKLFEEGTLDDIVEAAIHTRVLIKGGQAAAARSLKISQRTVQRRLNAHREKQQKERENYGQ